MVQLCLTESERHAKGCQWKLRRHVTNSSCGCKLMSSSPRFHDAKPTSDWAMAEFELFSGPSSWHHPSRNTRGMWDLTSIKPNRRTCSSFLFFFFRNVFKVTHVYQTHYDTHDLTDDNYSMSTFGVWLRADADSSPSPLYKNFRDSMSSHVCLFIIYLSPDIQEVPSQASHKSSCLSWWDCGPPLDFQLLLVNQNSILKINWVTERPLKANYNSTICYSHILRSLVREAMDVCVCSLDQLKDLIGLHCNSRSMENNGVVLPVDKFCFLLSWW